MKIALFNTHDNGGAGKAALRLNKGLNLIGVDSKLFVRQKSVQDSNVVQVISNEINNRLFDNLTMKHFINNIKDGNTISSIMYPSIGFDFLNMIKDFDIINLHWISMFISLEAILYMRTTYNKPIVWTLHDQNPMTGACHYAHGCDRYKNDCSECPQLVENKFNITKSILEAKVKYLPNDIIVVTPSKWMAKCARESTVFKKNRIEVIPNSLETDIYEPYGKSFAKKELGFTANTKLILFGAQDLKERRKGLHELLKSINILKKDEYIQGLLERNELCILTFGHSSPLLDDMNVPYKSIGYVESDEKLSMIYSASDVLVLPSLEDNLPNLMLESMSCGTPVVAFDTGGMSDTIINNVNGYLCPLYDSEKLAYYISKALKYNMQEDCRSLILDKYRLEIQAKNYNTLFQEISVTDRKRTEHINQHIPYIFPEVAIGLSPFICSVSKDIQNELYNLENERNVSIITQENLMQERDSVMAEREVLRQEWDNSILEFKKVKQERDTAIEEQERLRQERNKLIVYQENMRQERNKLIAYQEKLRQELDILILEQEKSRQEHNLLKAEQENIIGELEALKIENKKLAQERNTVSAELNSVYKSRSWLITYPIRIFWKLTKKFVKFILPYAIVRYYQKKKYGF
ncbi:D-inositol 3-phosphate glycosyltransferase [Oxobacter pfennigii]|uniref:D-inositol 3-phosphate glycosyltransferase n=1 Tax=Oxobacter pfennigii TaxID=36849 RepID=A0A0P8WMD9_9CLOT|nr:glycosyltransferase [Oxobacter pfennigii]KPU43683.1 D-inositol 3-phosphate glycosyltransferase [Oxobacter pfennigii]